MNINSSFHWYHLLKRYRHFISQQATAIKHSLYNTSKGTGASTGTDRVRVRRERERNDMIKNNNNSVNNLVENLNEIENENESEKDKISIGYGLNITQLKSLTSEKQLILIQVSYSVCILFHEMCPVCVNFISSIPWFYC